jgi:hypothetical protein
MMNTTGISRNWSALAAAALILGMGATAQAEPLEEITVHETSAAARAQRANFEAEMAAYVRSVEAAIEEARRQRLREARPPQIRVALAHELRRG